MGASAGAWVGQGGAQGASLPVSGSGRGSGHGECARASAVGPLHALHCFLHRLACAAAASEVMRQVQGLAEGRWRGRRQANGWCAAVTRNGTARHSRRDAQSSWRHAS